MALTLFTTEGALTLDGMWFFQMLLITVGFVGIINAIRLNRRK